MANDSAYIGGAPMTDEFMDVLNRQASGMPPVGAVDVTARFNGEDVTVPVSLARDALHKHMAFLRGKASAEVTDPYKYLGNGPYLDQMRAQWQVMADMAAAEAEQVKAELERLGKLTDPEIVRWAVESGHIGRHANGGWVVV